MFLYLPPALSLSLSLSLHSYGEFFFFDACPFDCVLYGLDAIRRGRASVGKTSLDHHGIDSLGEYTSGCCLVWFPRARRNIKATVHTLLIQSLVLHCYVLSTLATKFCYIRVPVLMRFNTN